jgi:hypothetical protein
MVFNFAAAKATVHRTVHDTFGLDALYLGYSDDVEPVPLRVRWHNQIANSGDLNGEYALSIDTIDKLIFDAAELVAKGIKIRRGDRIQLTAAYFGGVVLEANTRDPKSEAAREIWHVGRAHGPVTT